MFKSTNEKILDDIVKRIDVNMSNNYKDNAQSAFREFEELLSKFEEEGKLKPKALAKYKSISKEYVEKLQGFTHKDQKPYWT